MPTRRWMIARRSASWLLVLGSSLLVGCATMFGSTSQKVFVTSDPIGAIVVDSATGESFVCPVVIIMSKRESHTLTFRKEGYRQVDFSLRREASVKWWVIDAFTLGIGNIVDATTGALFDIAPPKVYVVLEKEE